MLRASVIKGDARIQLIKDSRQKLDDTRKGLHDKETLLSKHNTEYSNIGGQDYMIMATLRDLKQEHARIGKEGGLMVAMLRYGARSLKCKPPTSSMNSEG